MLRSHCSLHRVQPAFSLFLLSRHSLPSSIPLLNTRGKSKLAKRKKSQQETSLSPPITPRKSQKKHNGIATNDKQRIHPAPTTSQVKKKKQEAIPIVSVTYNKEELITELESFIRAKNLPILNVYAAKTAVTEVLNLTNFRQTRRTVVTSSGTPCLEATVEVQIDQQRTLTSTGHGTKVNQALECAWVHALSEICTTGLIHELYPSSSNIIRRVAHIPPSVWKTEQDALKDVYDYCSRFDEKPQIRSSRNINRPAEVIVEILFPKQDIKARGASKGLAEAYILAAIAFKQSAEEYHQKHGQSELVVKDFSYLTTETAQKFLQYHAMNVKGKPVNFSVRNSRFLWIATITMGDEELGSVKLNSKKHAEDVANLVAAIEVKKREPKVYENFLKTISMTGGQLLKPIKPHEVELDRNTFDSLAETIFDLKKLGWDPSDTASLFPPGIRDLGQRGRPSRYYTPLEIDAKSRRLASKLKAYHQNEAIGELRTKRAALPMSAYKEELLKLVKDNPVSIVIGATGSGKTTQLPQIILDDAIEAGQGGLCNIICTQPRRIAATSVALRVANERNERLQETVGYQVRFDSKPPQFNGSINFCTTGVMLRQLQDSIDDTLRGITHIIVDEVHERDIQIDFLLVILKRMMKDRISKQLPLPKIILMSATIDSNLFADYFKEFSPPGTICPKIDIPGRTFPVACYNLDEIYEKLEATYTPVQVPQLYDHNSTIYYSREKLFKSRNMRFDDSVNADFEMTRGLGARINWDDRSVIGSNGQAKVSTTLDDVRIPYGLIATLIAHISSTTTEGSILVFLPGLQEITFLNELLTKNTILGMSFNNPEQFKIYMLHSSIPQMQQEVFDKLSLGIRKIILATNIAETSITIPDVVFVVDTGKHREMKYDQSTRISTLACTWVSKSSARQRSGRAGRVQHGHYYSLMTKERFESLETAATPEILRSDLQKICLDIKLLGLGNSIEQVLSEAIQPPSAPAVVSAVQHLMALDAMDSRETLTPLGRVLAILPVEPTLGKMVLLGVVFKCLDPILILAAAVGTKDPFLNPPGVRQQAEQTRFQFMKQFKSDQIGLLNAFNEWRRLRSHSRGRLAQNEFAFNNFLHKNTLITIEQTARQVLDLLVKAKLVKHHRDLGLSTGQFGPPELNTNSGSIPLIKSLLTAGLYPNIASRAHEARIGLRTQYDALSIIHGSSVNSSRQKKSDQKTDPSPSLLYTFATKVKTGDDPRRAVLLRSTTAIDPLSIIFYARQVEQKGWVLTVDKWLPFFVRGRSCSLLLDFREAIYTILSSTFSRLGQEQFDAMPDEEEGDWSFGMENSHPSRIGQLTEIDPELMQRERLTNGLVAALELYDQMSGRPVEKLDSEIASSNFRSPLRRPAPYQRPAVSYRSQQALEKPAPYQRPVMSNRSQQALEKPEPYQRPVLSNRSQQELEKPEPYQRPVLSNRSQQALEKPAPYQRPVMSNRSTQQALEEPAPYQRPAVSYRSQQELEKSEADLKEFLGIFAPTNTQKTSPERSNSDRMRRYKTVSSQPSRSDSEENLRFSKASM